MPKRAKPLSAIEVKRLGNGVHAVGGVSGLALQVNGQARSWILRTTVGSKRREIGLGPYPEVSLAMAREKAAQTRELIREGSDPVEQRKTARAELIASQHRGLLFSAAVDAFTPIKLAELSPGKYRDQWRDSLDKYAMPELGQMLVHEIALQDILRVLEPIWSSKTVTADKLRRKLNEVLDYATVKGHRDGPNPARWQGNLALVLPSPANVTGEDNYPAVQLRDLSRFWEALSERKGMGAAALKFQTMTATRTGAVRFMTWDEVDFDTRIWTVQPRRQSAKILRRERPKRVPLTSEMVSLLKSLPRDEGSNLVFWAPRGGPLSDAVPGKLMRIIHEADVKAGNLGFVDAKTGKCAVPHGTRSTFKVWATEKAGFDWNLSKAALWYRLGNKVEQAYARTDLIEQRRRMMAEWISFLSSDQGRLAYKHEGDPA